ncbi:MAG: hypothetical protein PHP17_01270 [Candidatus Omnitrophica bacterium]|nr:hypothetical protein [Candidatus Omnitrophota bacterium]
MKKILLSIFCLLGISFVLFTFSPIFADTPGKSIKYLPHDEAIESVNKEYDPPLRKSGVSCHAAFDDASRCFYCVNTLKPKCPDCCLKFSPERAARCTPKDSSIYQCKSLAFSSNSCSSVASCKCPGTAEECNTILYNCEDCPDAAGAMTCSNIPKCQQKGCPLTEPAASTGRKCIYKNDSWICEENNLRPKFTGCPSGVNIPGCAVPTYYTILPSTNCQGLSTPAPNDCYEYMPTAEYSSCISGCGSYSDEWEKCTKRVYCCNKNVCGTGFENNCEMEKCTERVSWPECDSLTLSSCITLQQQAIECLTNPSPGSACANCFEEIDTGLRYKFVARSRETFIIFWQVAALTEFSGTVNASEIPTYFFTMVKVVDSKGKEVHRSIIHQKSFQGSFSIFSATSLDGSVVKQGETYTVRLYYFLPQSLQIPGYQNLRLSAKINKAELIIMRTRE